MNHRFLNCVVSFIIFFLLDTKRIHGNDNLPPDSGITITWDVMQRNSDTYNVKVRIENKQVVRGVAEGEGWRISWKWSSKEVIWSIHGAEATEQGDCSNYTSLPSLPHSCLHHPVIVDLLPQAPPSSRYHGCCNSGFLTSSLLPGPRSSAFLMSVGSPNSVNATPVVPSNFSLGLPGYHCGRPFPVPPSRFQADSRRRRTQALLSWKIRCIYSRLRTETSPKCCVSLSAFYSSSIVSCPTCSCTCSSFNPPCLRGNETKGVRCTDHMCPIRVHWHVKQSYKNYWRVKVTITNFNISKNFTNWNLMVLHPNLRNLTRVYSFNYAPLVSHRLQNDTGVFWGIEHYNTILMRSKSDDNNNSNSSSSSSSSVQTDILFGKEEGVFTFKNGWAFPRRISFGGDDCVMPNPDKYPRLPAPSFPFVTAPASLLVLLILWLFSAIAIAQENNANSHH